jgi:hypothetical protein
MSRPCRRRLHTRHLSCPLPTLTDVGTRPSSRDLGGTRQLCPVYGPWCVLLKHRAGTSTVASVHDLSWHQHRPTLRRRDDLGWSLPLGVAPSSHGALTGGAAGSRVPAVPAFVGEDAQGVSSPPWHPPPVVLVRHPARYAVPSGHSPAPRGRPIGVATMDPQQGLREIRAAARLELPGASIRRGLYYRYLLNWDRSA